MLTTIFAYLDDDGQLGARTTVYSHRPPAVCPGLGGWKGEPGEWWTRVKGQPASALLAATLGAGRQYVGLRMATTGRIEAVAVGQPDDMDADLADADLAGRLVWRGL